MTQAETSASRRLSLVSLLVRDYDEAIAFYAGKLGFEVMEDTELSSEKRWVVVGPKGGQASLLLAKAVGKQAAAIGQQAGGRVFLFLETDNFARDYACYRAKGIAFREQPRVEAYGTVAVFEDLYGNPWDLIEPAVSHGSKSKAEAD